MRCLRPLAMAFTMFCAACPGDRPAGIQASDGPASADRTLGDGDLSGLSLPDGARYLETGACGPSSCSGCCLGNGSCTSGNDDTRCGKQGMVCVDCTAAKAVCQLGSCCTPQCSAKTCGASDACGGTCKVGSGCCNPKCSGQQCGVPDGCGGTCKVGSGCCTPACTGKVCGASDGCGGTCSSGSGCCNPSCSGKKCGSSDGCGGTCQAGSGCCSRGCSGASCGASDGCGGKCSGSCPLWEYCSSSKQCVCGPSGHYKKTAYGCRPSCGTYLGKKGLPDKGGGCCSKGCKSGTYGGGPGDTHDCTYCCSTTVKGASSCK